MEKRGTRGEKGCTEYESGRSDGSLYLCALSSTEYLLTVLVMYLVTAVMS